MSCESIGWWVIDLINVAIYGQGELKRVSEADRIVSMMFPSPADREPMTRSSS